MSSEAGLRSDGQTTKILSPDDLKTAWQDYSITSLYDPMGKRYEDAYSHIPEQAQSLNWLISQLPLGSRVLDIGCGTGKPTADALASAGHTVYGIDISEGMLEVARKQIPLATFERIDFREFTTEPATYDAITSYFAFLVAMPQDQIREMIQKIYNWLKPGGLFAFGTVPADIEHLPAKWLGTDVILTSMSEDQYANCFRETGFTIVHQKASVFVPKAVEAGLCKPEETGEEHQLFIYLKKP
jgi:cyclopropane fatty-acyl-phospholipid synthase-like methyltransferase